MQILCKVSDVKTGGTYNVVTSVPQRVKNLKIHTLSQIYIKI